MSDEDLAVALKAAMLSGNFRTAARLPEGGGVIVTKSGARPFPTEAEFDSALSQRAAEGIDEAQWGYDPSIEETPEEAHQRRLKRSEREKSETEDRKEKKLSKYAAKQEQKRRALELQNRRDEVVRNHRAPDPAQARLMGEARRSAKAAIHELRVMELEETQRLAATRATPSSPNFDERPAFDRRRSFGLDPERTHRRTPKPWIPRGPSF